MKRVIVATKCPRRVRDLCTFARLVAARLSEDPLFSRPDLVTLLDARALALEAAVAVVETRRRGAAAERKARQRALLDALGQARSYVQAVASGNPPLEAAMIVERAGLSIKDAKGPTRAALAVKPGGVSGTARVYVRAEMVRASYEWQYAQAEGAWVSLPSTPRAKTTLEGLVPGALYWVRVRSLTADGRADWSEPVSFRVA
jgi:hypothetical protein